MTNLFFRILESVLFPSGSKGTYAFRPAGVMDKEQISGLWDFRHITVPEECQVRSLPDGEAFVYALRDELTSLRPVRSLIFSPSIEYSELSENLRSQFRRAELHEIALLVAMEALPSNSHVGILLPPSSLYSGRSAAFREALLRLGTPRWFIKLNMALTDAVFEPYPLSFHLHLLIVETGATSQSVCRFFKVPEEFDSDQDVVSDLERLAQQSGGETQFGYVVREGIPAESPWLFEAHDPALRQQVRQLQHYGSTRPLRELVDIRYRIGPSGGAKDLIKGDSDFGVPVIEGRNIRSRNELNLDETRYRFVGKSDDFYLREGDICIRSLRYPDERLRAVKIERQMLPLVAGRHVIVLRPLSPDTLDTDFLLAYLISDQAMRFLLAHKPSTTLFAADLERLPVPIMDPTLRKAVQDIREAVESFDRWRIESEKAVNSLFNFASAEDTRHHILSTGRRVRQRQWSAALVDDFSYRVRTQFPHPIAYRWRSVEASRSDLEGYLTVLECAETLMCYLACVTLAAARALPGRGIGYLASMADGLTRRGRGTTFGDWMAIVREGQNLKQSGESVPFYEVTGFVNDDVDEALQLLKRRRDDQAHGRGPRTTQQISAHFRSSKEAVAQMLKSVEFLSEYPLRLIEAVHRDTLADRTTYDCRELMGDHPLVPLTRDNPSELVDLEVGSLYLADRSDQLYLLRPFLTYRECPECGRMAIFFLDRYRKSDDVCLLKSIEHGHTMEDTTIAEAFRHVGVLT